MTTLPIRPVILLSLVVSLSASSLFLLKQNYDLSQSNQSLQSSVSNLQAKALKLRKKNRVLFTVLARNANLYSSVRAQKQSLQETITYLKKQEESLQYEMKKIELQMNTALEEKTYLEDMLLHKSREIESLKNQPSTLPGSTDGKTIGNSEITSKIKEKEAQIQKLTEQNRALSERMDRLYQVTTSKISEINVAKIALEETVSGAKDQIDGEFNAVNLGSISVDGKPSAVPVAKPVTTPKNAGKVLAINESHGFVVVDLGKVDNLNSGASLKIFRDGKSIANLSVLEVRDAMTACNIKYLETGEKIRINDAVQIQR